MEEVPDKPAHISQEDWDGVDVHEATDEEWSRAVPFKDAHPEAYAEWKRGRERPKVEQPRVHVGFRLSADVANGIKATGKGYSAWVEKVLRDALARGDL